MVTKVDAANAPDKSFLMQAKVHTGFKHLVGSPLMLEIELVDEQLQLRTQEIMLLPDDAERVARGLLIGLARMGRRFAGEEDGASDRLVD